MRTELHKGKTIFRGIKHGISLIYDFKNKVFIRLGVQGKLGNTSYYCTPTRKNGRYRKAYHPIKKIKPQPIPKSEKVILISETPPDTKVPECPLSGLILASLQGYWLINIDPLHPLKSVLTWLGNNPAHDCIKLIIGSVTRYTDDEYISGLPARWAFVDRIRKFCMPTKYTTSNFFPYKTAVVGRNEYYGGIDSVSFAHYGYRVKMEPIRNGVQSVALPGGVYGATAYKWFSKNFLCLFRVGADCTLYDTIGLDSFKSSAGYANPYNIQYGRMRIRGLKPPVDCKERSVPNATTNSLIGNRIVGLVNNARMCDFFVDPTINVAADYAVANDYALEMAVNSHFSHTGFTGSTLVSRATAGGLTWSLLAEVLALVENPGLPDATENFNAVADQIIEAWENSPVHWDAVMSESYFRFTCAVQQNEVSGKWYACGILRTIESDVHLFEDEITMLAVPPPMDQGTFEPGGGWENTWVPTVQHVTCRGFSTVPIEEAKGVYLTHRIWEGSIYSLNLFGIKIQDNFEYKGDTGPLEGATVIPNTGIEIEYQDSLQEYNLDYLNGVNIRESVDIVNFYFQYTGDVQKDTYVRLHPIGGTTDNPDDDVSSNLISTNRANQEGNTTLFVGTCEIDNAQRGRTHGSHANPYQTITVGGIFHSNSGYTVILYTVPTTLYNAYVEWDHTYFDDGYQYVGTMYQRYYKVQQSLWCAVVYNGELLARWEVKGLFEEVDFKKLQYTSTIEIVTQTDPPLQDFIINFDGYIESGSVVVECFVENFRCVFTDNGDGVLTEVPNIVPGQEYVLGTSSIDYYTGTVSLTFGSLMPGAFSEIMATARVSQFMDSLVPFAATTEIISESWYPGYQPSLYVSTSFEPVSFNTNGVYPGGISGTITEDGKYVVLSLHPFTVTPQNAPIQRVTSGGYVPTRYLENFTLKRNDIPTQVLVYDLTQIEDLEPRIASGPLFLTREKLTETVVLN